MGQKYRDQRLEKKKFQAKVSIIFQSGLMLYKQSYQVNNGKISFPSSTPTRAIRSKVDP